jgi:hypothetical protein
MEEKNELLREVVEAFCATNGTITRDDATRAMKKLDEIKPRILKLYTKQYTKKLREGTHDREWRYALTVLRQLLSYHGRKLFAMRRYVWDKKLKTQIAHCASMTWLG